MIEVTAPPSLEELFALLHAQQYRGAVVIHFDQGKPNHVEIPRQPQRIVLDKPKRLRAPLTR